jgi:UDP-glucose 4-epimerase
LAHYVVTGGAGFVGSHLTEKLTKLGNEVTVIDDLSNGSLENLKGIPCNFINFDISEPFLVELEKKSSNAKIKAIIHLACFPRSMSFDNPIRDVDVNVKGMVNVLKVAMKNKCKVVFSSNSGIYGSPNKLPINESCADLPSSPYDVDKLAAEYYLKVYNQTFGIPATIFRFGTVYGSKQKVSPQWKPVIAEFVCKMLKGKAPTIDGTGQQTRDFIHVSDIVNALIKSTEVETDLKPIILASNTETSINTLYAIISKQLGFKLPPNKAPAKIGDIMRMWYDNKRAKDVLGWSPKTTLDDALSKDVIPYYKNKLKA